MAYDWDYVFRHIGERISGFFHGLIPLTQDKSSQVEFYLVDAFEISHYLPLVNALNEQGIRARIVAEPGWINTAGHWFDYKTAIKTLKREGIAYVTKANPEARVAVTTQYGKHLAKYPRARKMQMYYGVGIVPNADFMTDPEVTRAFDYVLVHGAYSKKIISQTLPEDRVIVMSYPRYASLLQKKPSQEEVRKELGIPNGKPVLTYCPTWDAYSSIRTFAPRLKQLKDRFFILVKPHHCTVRNLWNDTDYDVLCDIADLMTDANYSFVKTSLAGDINVTDIKSGASTEMPYVNPDAAHVICQVNVADEDVFARIGEYAAVAKTPDDLLQCIKQVYPHDPYADTRREIMRTLYDPDTEGCIRRTVELIGLNVAGDTENTVI